MGYPRNTSNETTATTRGVCELCDGALPFITRHGQRQTVGQEKRSAIRYPLEQDGDTEGGARGGSESNPGPSVRRKTSQKRNKGRNGAERRSSGDGHTERETLNGALHSSARAPRSHVRQSPHVRRITDMIQQFGYSDEEISIGLHRLQVADQDVTYDSLIDYSMEARNDMLSERVLTPSTDGDLYTGNDDVMNRSASSESNEQHDDVDNDEADDDLDDIATGTNGISKETIQRAIENRKQQLRDQIESMTFRCRFCNEAKATILLLPCAHLASCENCLMDVRRCPLPRCNKIVRGTKEVFYV